MYTIDVSDKWFSRLRDGTKPVECRKCSPKFSHLRVGDVVTINNATTKNLQESFRRGIVDIRFYKSLADCIINEGLIHILPGITSLEAGEAAYLEYWTRDEIELYGIMALQLS